MLNYQRVNHRHKPHCWEKSFTWWWIDGDQHFWVPNVLLWPDMCGFACALTFLVQVGVEKHYQSYSPQSAHQKTKKTTRNYQMKVCTTLQVILSPYEVLLNVYPPGPVVPKNLQKSRYQDLGPIAALPVLELLRELLDVVELFLHIQSSGCTFDGHTSRPGRDGEQNAEPWKENLTIAWSVQFN